MKKSFWNHNRHLNLLFSRFKQYIPFFFRHPFLIVLYKIGFIWIKTFFQKLIRFTAYSNWLFSMLNRRYNVNSSPKKTSKEKYLSPFKSIVNVSLFWKSTTRFLNFNCRRPNLLKTRMVVTPDYQSLLTLNLILWKNHTAKIQCFHIQCTYFRNYLC